MSIAATNQLQLCTKNFLQNFRSLQITSIRSKYRLATPRLRNPVWFVKKNAAQHDEGLTRDNTQFIQSVVHEKYGPSIIKHGIETYERPVQSIVNISELPEVEWKRKNRRCGLICRKIGQYPLWKKDGSKIQTTLLQVVDNHVVKYTPPERYTPMQKPKTRARNLGCMLVGAISTDPSVLTKAYCDLFKNTGVMPKSVLRRFLVSPSAALPPGTPLNVTHFRVGDSIDVRGNTIDRGFQGVMKRWGFAGQPATHGQTKTHRRPGNIGGGGEKGRVWPGKKMPGHMGNRWRVLRGLTIWRINTKYNVMWVSGDNIPGETNSLCYIFDTILPLRLPKTAPPYPTAPEVDDLPEEMFHEELHDFLQPTITFEPEDKK